MNEREKVKGMRAKDLLSKQAVTDMFTAVYVLVDDYLQAVERPGRFKLPRKCNQKASYSELMTIVLVGELLQQKNQGLWYLLIKSEYKQLFPTLPELSRFYRIQRNFERVYADLALLIAEHGGVYTVGSQPLPICKGVRYTRDRLLSEAASGRGGATKQFYGFRLHAVCRGVGAICRFGIAPANEHDLTVARCLLDERYDDLHSLIGDKAYLGLGIYTPPKQNAKEPGFWSGFFARARKSIKAVFSSLQRCRKVAAHNLILFA